MVGKHLGRIFAIVCLIGGIATIFGGNSPF